MGIRNKEMAPTRNYGNTNGTTMKSPEERDSLFLEDVDDESGGIFEDGENSEEYEENLHDPIEKAQFWESQTSLLQEVLERYYQTGSKLRQEVCRIVAAAKQANICNCDLKPNSDGCIRCLRQTVVDSLCQRGLEATLCTSKWSNNKKFPGGKHEYIEVIASTSVKKKQIPYIIELEFRDQFIIAKACDEYQNLVSLLPEYYIGKADCLSAVVRVLCDAAKRSMKEKKLHMGPWRKRSFIQMKWSNSLNKWSNPTMMFSGNSEKQAQDQLPGLHFPSPRAVVVT